MYTTWRDSYISLAKHSIEVVVSASDDEKDCEYMLSYSLNAGGETVKVLAPELIADITAYIEKDGTRLYYDGVMLETGSTFRKPFSTDGASDFYGYNQRGSSRKLLARNQG